MSCLSAPMTTLPDMALFERGTNSSKTAAWPEPRTGPGVPPKVPLKSTSTTYLPGLGAVYVTTYVPSSMSCMWTPDRRYRSSPSSPPSRRRILTSNRSPPVVRLALVLSRA